MPKPLNLDNLPPDVREKYLAIKARLPQLREDAERDFTERNAELVHSAELGDAERQVRIEILRLLRELREARGLTEADVERAAGLPRATISTMETNPRVDASLSVLQRYATALGRRLALTLDDCEVSVDSTPAAPQDDNPSDTGKPVNLRSTHLPEKAGFEEIELSEIEEADLDAAWKKLDQERLGHKP